MIIVVVEIVVAIFCAIYVWKSEELRPILFSGLVPIGIALCIGIVAGFIFSLAAEFSGT